MLTEEIRRYRREFLPIAVIEHHHLTSPSKDVYEISEILGKAWEEIQLELEHKNFDLSVECISELNNRLVSIFGLKPGEFLKKDEWPSYVDECGDIDEDPSHSLNWIFSALYWDHLTKLRLATSWIFISALKIQHDLPVSYLSLKKLGSFMNCLSGSGPPLYDGQSFYLEHLSD